MRHVKSLSIAVALVAVLAAVLLPPAVAAAAPGPSVEIAYKLSQNGRRLAIGFEGSMATYKARSLSWDDRLMPGSKVSVNDIDVFMGRAYVAAGTRGLRIVNVGDPARAAEAGSWQAGPSAQKVSVWGSYAYVADLHQVYVVDIGDPAAPLQVSSFWMDGDNAQVDDVQVVKDIAYMAGRDGTTSYLLIFDVSDQSNPVFLGSCRAADSWSPVRLTVYGSRVYVGGNQLSIIDVRDPYRPARLWTGWAGRSRNLTLCAGPAVDGTYAFVASDDQAAAFRVKGTFKYVGSLVASWPEATGVQVALTEAKGAKRYALVVYNEAGDLNGFIQILDATHPLRLDHDHGEYKGQGSVNCVTVHGDWALTGWGSETRPNLVIHHLGPTGYSWVFDRRARTVPDRRADGYQSGLTGTAFVKASGIGSWWFHVRGRGPNGRWGKTSHFRFRVQ